MKTNKLKTYLKFGILLLGSSLILINCRTDELTFEPPKQIDAKTVSFEEAKAFFKNKKGNDQFAKRTSSNELILNPDWNSLEHSDLVYTEAQLTKANTEVNRNGEYTSKLLFVNIDDQIKSVILTTWVTDYDAENNIVNATVYFNDYDGAFMDAYKIENGRFTKRLVPSINTQTASFFMFIQDIFTPDCWNTDDLEGGELETVDLGSVNSGSSGFDGGIVSGPANGPGTGSVNYSGYVDSGLSEGSGYTGNNSISKNGVDLGATLILMNPPIDPDERGNCPPGYAKNPTTGKCDPICNGGKTYSTSTEECNCPRGKTEDDNGNCVETPCPGDPVFNPEIAPQTNSGIEGGMFGNNNYNNCPRKGGTDCSGPRNLKHEGLDLKNPYGAPIYAMYDGLASIHYFEKTGYIVLIQSEIDGESISIQYFHMQNENRVTGQVSAGQIIGYQGDSGNLASGIKQGLCVSHLHIKAKNSANQAIDPRQFLTTEIDNNGNSSSSDNCN